MDITSIIDKGLEFKNIAEYDNALECFNKAIAINPNNYVPYKNKGDILFKQGNDQAAIDEFDKAISVNPEKDHMTYYLKGTVYFKQERYNEAIQCYNETLSINPKYLNAIMNKGLALFKLDDYSQAIVSYDEALKINPKHIYSLNGKGIALCKLGQYNEAISIYNKVLEIDANNEEAIKNKNIATNVAGFTVMPENPISIGKKAIVIGINEYQSLPAEKNLQGAQNDANEIYNILRKNGYTIEDSDFLVGNRATHRAISKSINNAFRKRSSYGTILFYYSGLGLVDDNKDAYIAPYDIDPLDPFVNGISVDELNRIMDNSKNNSKFVTIFDCCYVDNAIEDAKGVTELVYKSPIGPRSNGNVFEVANKGVTKGVSEGLVILNDSFKKIANPDINKPVSASKIIIASSQADSAHEKIFDHNDNSHHHGIFSYYLIEGLLGKASPTEEGDITPDKIFKYIEAKMKNDGTQLIAYGAQVQQDVIRIALASYGEKDTQIKEIFEKANDSISTNDFASLIYAAKLLWVLEDVRFNPYLNDSQKYEYGAIRKKLESSLSEYGNDLYNWFIDNQTQYAAILFTKQFKESRKNIYSELTTLCENLTYEIVANISQQDKRCLMAVFRFMKSPKNEDEKLEELEREVKRLV